MVIESIYLLYGAIFLATLLLVEGLYLVYTDTRVGRKRVARLMRWEGLWGCSKQRFKQTATVRAELPAAPNLLDGDFHSEAPDRVWVGDVMNAPESHTSIGGTPRC